MKFSTMFHISSTIKSNSSKVKTRNTFIKWDTQSSEESVLISYFLLLQEKRSLHCLGKSYVGKCYILLKNG